MKRTLRIASFIGSCLSLAILGWNFYEYGLLVPPSFFTLKGAFVSFSGLGMAFSVAGEMVQAKSQDEENIKLMLRSISSWAFLVAVLLFAFHSPEWLSLFQISFGDAFLLSLWVATSCRLFVAGMVAMEEFRLLLGMVPNMY